MKVYLNDKNYKHEIFELIRMIIGEDNFEFVDETKENNLNITIEENLSIIYKENNNIIYNSYIENFEEKTDDLFTKKQLVKSEILKFFKRVFNKVNPWGVLTGIRPVKIAKKLMEKYSEKETLEHLENKLLLQREKAELITEIAKIEEVYLSKLLNDSYSIYINIPFCPTRCDYCSFSTLKIGKHKDLVPKYLEVLKKELFAMLHYCKNLNLNTIYIGGGTPTSLNDEQLEDLLKYINENISELKSKEFTVEAGREDTITKSKLEILKKYNVDRISLNPQTFNENTLKLIGRKQNNTELIKRYNDAKNMGFESINMDLIIGLPEEDIEDIKNTLEIIKSLQPENLTVHTLSVKKGSKLNEKSIELKDEVENIEKMMDMVKEFAKKNDYIPYYIYRQKQILGNMENIGFSKIGKECIYNITMMEEEENIVGVGMGSSTKILKNDGLILNHRNYKNMRDYINKIDIIIEEKKGLIGG
ncbi:coproporphyrinogen dehydrogenase HemZ [Miniphocaeibacter massiliensis]|uniref:coproporphyrinogen dehydrogenase HemZ n=1 Tax=Miniphocaeibacter massiliensis TaxID=2041841 RepID=UPI000C1C0410|nr:coproporphyrinogen dehydrogenase HemZ [Miniphocaeibacter massiliensis]